MTTRKKLLLAGLSMFFASVFAGCGSTKDLTAANEAVKHFHAQLDDEQFDTIYSQADQQFRDSSSRADYVAFVSAVHRKLGKVLDATRTVFFINWNTSGTQIRLSYKTKFNAGDAEEQFVWLKNGDDLKLLDYHINSMALITK